MIPMRFEPARCCQTHLGEDEDGEPDRVERYARAVTTMVSRLWSTGRQALCRATMKPPKSWLSVKAL